MKRFIHAILPAILLSLSVGQIYAFTNFSDGMTSELTSTLQSISRSQVQFAFSLGIFFLGMGAAFFGRLVERNIRLAALTGTGLFLGGLLVTEVGLRLHQLLWVYLGYGFLLGLGTGIVYIAPVKTLMLWFPKHKALASALPIISFGLGSTLSTILYQTILREVAIIRIFSTYAGIYAPCMLLAVLLLKKPILLNTSPSVQSSHFSYKTLLTHGPFIRYWLFMLLNISAGLCLIPLAKQMMTSATVGYSVVLASGLVACSGLFNGGGRLVFAWISDRLSQRTTILKLIIGLSLAVIILSFWAPAIGLALLVINACYGAGFSVLPALLSETYGLDDLSKIHGAVLSAWGVAGLVGNQLALVVSYTLGLGYFGVMVLLVLLYGINGFNVHGLIHQGTRRGL